MARKQSDYLAALLADEPGALEAAPTKLEPAPDRPRGTTLLSRESALARVASGEVRQVTQLLIDPARARIWPGNARTYEHLSEANCRELIDALIAEGGQKVPAVVRRVSGDPDHEYEVIAGTRRHWAISWLRSHSYPDMQFLAQVAQLDDEAAFRLADIENRARKDVSDLERARNYATALRDHYQGHQTRMAERLKFSKGWLSKMIKVASIPDSIVAAFASPGDVQLAPAYGLAQLLDDRRAAKAVEAEAKVIVKEQAERRAAGLLPSPAPIVLRRLLDAPKAGARPSDDQPFVYASGDGRPLVTLQSSNRQGVTVRLHAGAGGGEAEFVEGLRQVLAHLEAKGRRLQ
ncbi:ParB/RepB/Spo0J family partition protein [Sphingomonas lenta]|uniref:Chromosome partitioning protein ParB n=1 Tax=Sphingomonas lenta TaxID=1141887 RepID=A0A2A2SAV1_9SPHN|nr:ParB/RepB/Spo0J family partition protein [Sphingomonas lenta]PAX06379.1 chromosome partitioning protein ParB [Sphingomonas lenta]